MVLQIVMHSCSVQLVFVMNKVILNLVTMPTRTAELKEKGGELVMLLFFPNLRYFGLHNCMYKNKEKFSIFKDLT